MAGNRKSQRIEPSFHESEGREDDDFHIGADDRVTGGGGGRKGRGKPAKASRGRRGAGRRREPTLGFFGLVRRLFYWCIVLGIWGIRFAVAHSLAAVDYPIKTYIYAVNGLGISLRLAGLGIVGALPVLIAFYGLIKLVAPDVKEQDPALAFLIALATPMSYVMTAILTPAGCYALKEILARVRPEKSGFA